MSQRDDPNVIRAQIEGIQNLIFEQARAAEDLAVKVKDPHARQAIIDLASSVALLNTLLMVALGSHKRGPADASPRRP